MTEPASPSALDVRLGSVEGMSFHIKALEAVVVAKEASILVVTVPRFQRAMLRTTGKVTAFAFVLEVADDHNEFHYGPF